MTRPFTNWKKAVEKMKAHAQTQVHSQPFTKLAVGKGSGSRDYSQA